MTYILSENPEVLENLIHELRSLNPLLKWKVTIKEYKKNLTANQRNYWHKLIDIIAGEIGESPAELKMKIKYKVCELKQVQMKDGTVHKYPPSSEDLTRDQYSELIAATKELGYFLQIELPDPRHFGYE